MSEILLISRSELPTIAPKADQHAKRSSQPKPPTLGGNRQAGTVKNIVRNVWASRSKAKAGGQQAAGMASSNILGGAKPAGPAPTTVRSAWADWFSNPSPTQHVPASHLNYNVLTNPWRLQVLQLCPGT